MGFIRHDAIIVTSFSEEHIRKAHIKASDLDLACSPVVASPVNGFLSFMIAPDGSKEGWPQSDVGDEQRAEWKVWARQQDGFLDWAHVQFGGDDGESSHLIDHGDAPTPV